MTNIVLEKMHYGAIHEQIELARKVYQSPEVIDPLHIQWKHINGICGPSFVVAVRDGIGVLQGRSFLQTRKFFTTSGVLVNGAVVTDLVVNPAARNALTLISLTRAIKSPKEIDVVIHTSNQTSDILYKALFKFPVSFTLKAFGIPLHFKNILKTHIQSTAILSCINLFFSPYRLGLRFASKIALGLTGVRFIPEPDSKMMNDIFASFNLISGDHFERNAAYLKWRFQDGPIFNGDIKWVGINNVCVGYVALSQVQINGISICVIMDAAMRRKLAWFEGIAIKFLTISYALKNSCDVVFTLINANNCCLKWLGRFPFVSIPDRLLPHPTPIFIHAPEEILSNLNRKRVFLTLADLDYF